MTRRLLASHVMLRSARRAAAAAVLALALSACGPSEPVECGGPSAGAADTTGESVPCPTLGGYQAHCNDCGACEYAADDDSGWRRHDVLIWVPPSSFPWGEDSPSLSTFEEPVTVTFAEGYWIERYEVTAAAFAAFLDRHGNDCGGTPCLHLLDGVQNIDWDEDVGRATVRERCQASPGAPHESSCADHPAVAVPWPGAKAFCEARGRRLCSEAEWERAAKGTTQQPYPWGAAEPDATRANSGLCSTPDPACASDGYRGSAPVGSFPAGRSPVGCDDMAGNAREWVLDTVHLGSDLEEAPPTDGSAWIGDPTWGRVARGGSWSYGVLRFGVRGHGHGCQVEEGESCADQGFRCCAADGAAVGAGRFEPRPPDGPPGELPPAPCFELTETPPSTLEPDEGEVCEGPVDPAVSVAVTGNTVHVRYTEALTCCWSRAESTLAEGAAGDIHYDFRPSGVLCSCVCPFTVAVAFTVCEPGDYVLVLDALGSRHPFTIAL